MYPVYLISCFHPSYGQNFMPYIGCILSSRTVNHRLKQHLRGGGHAPYIWNAVQKYGKEWFCIDQIDAGNTPEQALELEKFWIAYYKTKAPTGYNLKDGGAGSVGWTHSPEARAKIKAAKAFTSEETRTRMRDSQKTRDPKTRLWHSPKADAKRAETRTDCPLVHSEKTRQHMSQRKQELIATGWKPTIPAESRLRAAEKHRGMKRSEKAKQSMSAAWTPERRAALADRNRKRSNPCQ